MFTDGFIENNYLEPMKLNISPGILFRYIENN